MATPHLPRRIGRFAVVDLIGTGAFATVFRARDERLDTEVALKVLAENHSFDPDVRERFIMEGHLLRRVDSPHVVKVFDLDETDAGQPFLVLDLAAGGDLRARRRDHGDGAVHLDDVVAVADQVAAALAALHAEQVVHRDVTPGNLLIRSLGAAPPPGRLLAPGDRLMLADLGLSKDLALASGLTVGAGTAGFTPPEQRDAAWVDPRADIWSASALLVWLITGRQAEDRGWTAELRRRGAPDALVDVLARGLSPEVPTRHPDAAAWRDDVLTALVPSPAAPPPPGASTPAPGAGAAGAAEPASRPRLGRVVLLLVAVAAAGGLLGGVASDRLGGDDAAAVRTEDVGDGEVRTSASEGDLEVAVVGPSGATVGEAATFTAEVEGATRHVWIAPDGEVYVDTPTLTLTPDSAGEAEVVLLGIDEAGEVVSVAARLTVIEG